MHIDSLAERLKDPRVKRVIQPILAGDIDPELGRDQPDVQFCMDLGLVAWDDGLIIANPIYREVLIRVLNSGYQDGMAKPEFRWQKPDGDLDMEALMREFQVFWRERMDMLIEWKGHKHIIEIKLVHPRHGRQTTLDKGLQQIARYHDKVGEATQTLALFDRTESGRQIPWEERLKREVQGDVVVWWM